MMLFIAFLQVITSYYGSNLCQIDIIRTDVSVHDLFGDRLFDAKFCDINCNF